MNFKTILNGSVLFIGLGLAGYAWLNGYRVRFNVETVATDEVSEESERQLESGQLVPRSIYDGDTLRARRGEEELKIRFCGIDAPEVRMPMGIEARDHLRSLVDIGNGELLLLPIEQDRYGRTVAEVYVKDSRSTAINLNVQMVRDGYAWHYERYSGNCPIRGELASAQELAQKEGLGIWNGSPQPPWEFRRQAKK
ncbi:MAG: thermonuclease family protein [Pleurocapsa sp. MO_226.B13]|nr:thermonuclease family protein [Pleurocapsa sp. MO_226.B13]